MSTVEFLYKQAEECRRLAKAARSEKIALELLRLATEYERLAGELEPVLRPRETLH
jgi:hypothetical protein